MLVIAQRIDDRHMRVVTKTKELVMLEYSCHDHIDPPLQVSGNVRNRFSCSETDVVGSEKHGQAAKLSHAEVKRNTRSKARLFKDHSERLLRPKSKRRCA